MGSRQELEHRVLMAARDSGIGTILFRNSLAKKAGLNLTESFCLTILGIRGISRPSQLARIIGLSTGATTAMLDRLEKRGIIRRRPSPDDRRGVIIEVDQGYAKTAHKLVEGIQKAHRDLIASYTEKELEVVADFLGRFAENLRVHGDRIEGEDPPDTA